MTLRAFFLMSCLMLLSACGLSPVYGNYADNAPGTDVASSLESTYIDIIPNRTGQKLRNLMMDRFYHSGAPGPSNARYRLSVATVGESVSGLGIAKDATASRSQIRLYTTFTLWPLGDNIPPVTTDEDGNPVKPGPLIQRTVSAVSSFNTLASQYTTLVTKEDARDQTIKNLAQQITTMLELYFTNPAAFPSPQSMAEAEESRESVFGSTGDDDKEDVFKNNDPYRDISHY